MGLFQSAKKLRLSLFDASKSSAGATKPAVAAPRVLIVDDHVHNIEVLSQAIGAMGLLFDTASDGFEAIEQLAQTDYALVLLDYQMPRLDGTKVMTWLHNRPMAPPRILVLTSDARPETESMFRAMGCNGFLSKPVELPALIREVGRLLAH